MRKFADSGTTKPARLFLAALVAWTLLAACTEGAQQVTTSTILEAPDIRGCEGECPIVAITQAFAVGGETITLNGTGLTSPLFAEVGGSFADVTVSSDSEASLELPNGPVGMLLIRLVDINGKVLGVSSILRLSAEKALAATAPTQVCLGDQFLSTDGRLRQGTRDCLNTGTGDVGTSSTTSTGGTQERATTEPKEVLPCVADGQLGCIANAPFVAAQLSVLDPYAILQGKRLAGVNGALAPPVNACAAAAQVGCITTDDYPSMDLSRVDANPGLTATNLNEAVASGAIYEYWDASGNRQTLEGDADLIASNLLLGTELFGVTGTIPQALPLCSASLTQNCRVGGGFYAAQACSSDNQADCYLAPSGTYEAADRAALVEANIKRGVVIGGVTGAFPSNSYPLPRFSSGDPTNTTESGTDIPDLLTGNFLNLIKAEAAFEYWDSTGVRHESSGDRDVIAVKIGSGIDVFDVSGSAPLTRPCDDGTQGACEADTACRWTGSTCEVDPWNIRVGINIAGKVGELKLNCRNAIGTSANSDLFPPGNSGATTGTSFDWWDTVDPFDNGTDTLPSTIPTTAEDWTPANFCSTELWEDVTADGACDSATDDCLMRDRVTQLLWTESFPVDDTAPAATRLSWGAAVDHCDSLTYNDETGWRLPTQVELQQALSHGIWGIFFKDGTSARPGGETRLNNDFMLLESGGGPQFWSSTSASFNTGRAHAIILDTGLNGMDPKTGTKRVVCVKSAP